MTVTTWSTDAQIDTRCILGRGALAAYIAAQVKLGHPAPTGYDDQRAEAQEQITRRLRQAGINLSMVSRPTDLYQAELCLALALLFESTQQFARDGQGDLYAQQGKFWRAAYEDAFAQAAPIQNVRSEGAGFEFGRG